jgi:hypothetical protein
MWSYGLVNLYACHVYRILDSVDFDRLFHTCLSCLASGFENPLVLAKVLRCNWKYGPFLTSVLIGLETSLPLVLGATLGVISSKFLFLTSVTNGS